MTYLQVPIGHRVESIFFYLGRKLLLAGLHGAVAQHVMYNSIITGIFYLFMEIEIDLSAHSATLPYATYIDVIYQLL